MAQIIIDPQQVRDYGTKFDNSANQVQDLLNQVQNLVNTLQGGAWKGNRGTRFYGDWAGMKPQVVKAIETLHQTAQIMKDASNEFSITDGQ